MLPAVARVPARSSALRSGRACSRATGTATTCGCSRTMPTDGIGLRASLDARRRGLVLLAVVLHPPVVAPVVKRLTRKPRVESLDVDGVALDVLHPPGRGPWPAWLFINGAHPLRRREPVVWRLARGLTAGRLPGRRARHSGSRRGGGDEANARGGGRRCPLRDRAARREGGPRRLIGASTGAGLAVVTAGRPELASRVSCRVAAVALYADLPKLVCLTTTCLYDEDTVFQSHQVTELHKTVIARSLISGCRRAATASGCSPSSTRSTVRRPIRWSSCRVVLASFGPEARAVINLLENRDPERFQTSSTPCPRRCSRCWPTSRHSASQPSCAARRGRRPSSRQFFPLGEAEALARSLPNVHLTITGALDHTRPSLARLAEFRSFQRFVVRGLAASVGP